MKSNYIQCEYLQNMFISCMENRNIHKSICNIYKKKMIEKNCINYGFDYSQLLFILLY